MTEADLFADALYEPLRGAVFSECRTFRYRLWEIWDRSKPIVCYVMLNPSTADEVKNDPTVERCSRRALQMGGGGFRVANIFALRSTDPAALYKTDDSTKLGGGPHDYNNAHISAAARASNIVICGWGTHGKRLGRGRWVLTYLRNSGIKPHALKMTKCGEPGHPLYVPYSAQPFEIQNV